jgi:hypothetical protein
VAALADGQELPFYFPGRTDVVWTPLYRKDPMGDQEVAKIECNDGIYAAAMFVEGPFMFTHNPYNKV